MYCTKDRESRPSRHWPERVVAQHVAPVDERRALLPARVERAGVIALVVGVLDGVGFEDAVVAPAHGLQDSCLGAVARARRFVAPAQDGVVGRVVDVVEGVHVADARPEDGWLVGPDPLRVVMNLVARDQVVAPCQAPVQPALDGPAPRYFSQLHQFEQHFHHFTIFVRNNLPDD